MRTLLLPTLTRSLGADPGWSRLLGRANRLEPAAPGLSSQLAPCFGWAQGVTALPWAAILAADEGIPTTPGTRWLALEPLSLRVAPNGVYVVASNDFGQSHAQMRALWDSVDTLLGEEQLRLHPGRQLRAFIELPQAEPDPATVSAEDLLGVELTGWFPAQRVWRRRLNELQIVWSQHPVNQARLRQGQLPVNSPWFGSASTPMAAPATRPAAISSADPLLQALARWCGAVLLDAPEQASSADALLDLRDQPGAALRWLQAHAATPVRLHFACGARFERGRWHRLRFWRGALEPIPA